MPPARFLSMTAHLIAVLSVVLDLVRAVLCVCAVCAVRSRAVRSGAVQPFLGAPRSKTCVPCDASKT
jgi:hypothetical protein